MNDKVFDAWDERSAYLFGVLWADGHLLKRGCGVKFWINATDIDWLRIVHKAFSATSPIRMSDIRDRWAARRAAGFQFSSRRVRRRLAEIGFRKTTPDIPDVVMNHFVRGFFDGDGSVYKANGRYIHASFVGPVWFLQWLKDVLVALTGVSSEAGIHAKTNSHAVSSVRFAHGDTIKLGRFMYKDATLWLNRKRVVFGACGG
jgi:hypothetical protein